MAHKDEKILQLTQAAEESRQLSKMNDELRASIGKKEDELADLRTKLVCAATSTCDQYLRPSILISVLVPRSQRASWQSSMRT